MDESVIEAAGGIIECEIAGRTVLAIIRRDRYGCEWTIPKGKRISGESWKDTACREVQEETGLSGIPCSIAGCTSYKIKSAQKIVVYWRMQLNGKPPEFIPNEEAKELKWVDPKEAVRLLAHEEEKQMVRSIYQLLGGQGSTWLALNWISGPLRRQLRAKPIRRLSTTIRAYSLELSGRATSGTELERHLPDVSAALLAAESAANDGRLEEGWKCLLAAQRLEILFLNSQELQAVALALQYEATKLNSWRKAAVLDLLRCEAGTQIGMARVFRAAYLRDEHYHNEAYKDSLRRGSALTLAFGLVLATGGLLWTASRGEFQALEGLWKNKSFGGSFIALIALVGLLGANVSAITDLANERSSARIPEMVSTFRVTILRLFIGAASAIFLLFVTQSGLILQVPNGYAMLVLAFAAGFSERLVLRVVRSIVHKEESSA